MTWFRLGGTSRFLFRPRDPSDLSQFAARAKQEQVSVKLLGCGANVLVRDDGFDGVVVRLDQPAFCGIGWRGSDVEVGAGVELMPFARRCSSLGFSGLEAMAGIPATIGGAVRMNAGGRGGDFGDVVKEVRVIGDDGSDEVWDRNRLGFEYRRSQIGSMTVVSAKLELKQDDPKLTKAAFDDYFEQKKRTQPLADHSAGCIFRNPTGHSAGALIDQAGLKGMRSGHARVSERHANFIVADRGATSSDVLRLIDVVRERILTLFGMQLETEIDIW